MLRNGSVLDVKAKSEARKEHMPGKDADNLVFLDKSGINTDITSYYARQKQMNVQWTVHTIYQGGTTAKRFARYLKDTLLPM